MKLYIFEVDKLVHDKEDDRCYSDSDKVYIVAESVADAAEKYNRAVGDTSYYLDNIEVEAFDESNLFDDSSVYYKLIV